jgi:hypothetical protein
LLKSGILVENFTNTDKADLASGYFGVAVDTDEQECFPGFAVYNIDFDVVADTDIAEINDLITMKYVNEVFASQLEANSFINVNPGAINDGVGRAEISKKNSFSINIFLTGGLLLFGGLTVSKIIAAYSAGAPVVAEGILAVAWDAARNVGLDFFNSANTIKTLSDLASSGFSFLKDPIGFINSIFSSGSTTLLPGAVGAGILDVTALSVLETQLITSGLSISTNITAIGKTLGNIFIIN